MNEPGATPIRVSSLTKNTNNTNNTKNSNYTNNANNSNNSNNANNDNNNANARVTCYLGAPVSHVTSGRPWGKAEASKARQSRSKANQTVTPRVSHVTPGRACHMLPWGARVTCYSGAPLSHGRGEDVDRKEISFFACTTRGSSQRKSGQVRSRLSPGNQRIPEV